MRSLILFVLWCILLVLYWPLAILVALLTPVIILVGVAFQLVGIAIGAALALVKSVLFLPARLLGHR
jgi:hypothetical protein